MSQRVDTMARAYVDKKEAYEKANAEKKRAEEAWKAAQDELWDFLDDLGVTSLNVDLGPGYGDIQLQKRETIRGIVKDPAKAAAALEKAGLADALLGEPKIHQRALSEHVRDWLASGQTIPDGIDFNPTRYVSVTRK